MAKTRRQFSPEESSAVFYRNRNVRVLQRRVESAILYRPLNFYLFGEYYAPNLYGHSTQKMWESQMTSKIFTSHIKIAVSSRSRSSVLASFHNTMVNP